MFCQLNKQKPTSLALDFLINLTHSKLDFPVVITSSTIRTLEFLMEKPLLKVNLLFTLSQIVSFQVIFLFHNHNYTTHAGESIISIF